MRIASEWKMIALVLLFVGFIAFAAIMAFRAETRFHTAPCKEFSENRVGEIPVRCFKELFQQQ